MYSTKIFSIEVVYLSPDEQVLIPLNIPKQTNLREAIHFSKLLEKFPEINLDQNKIGIFGKIVPLETYLNDGDRIEIYRPLLIDPKQKRVLKVKKMRRAKIHKSASLIPR